MKIKKLLCAVLSVSLLLAMCAPLTNAARGRTVTAIYGTPKVDGVKDAAWSAAQAAVIAKEEFYYNMTGSVPEFNLKAYSMYDANMLYFWVEIADNKMSGTEQFFIYLNENGTKTRLVINCHDSTEHSSNPSGKISKFVLSKSGGKYIIEMAVNRASNAKDVDSIGLEYTYYDGSSDGITYGWNTTQIAEITEQSAPWGTLILAEKFDTKEITDFGLKFGFDGNFKIMVVADMSEHGVMDTKVLDTIKLGIAKYNPDLVVFNGDVTFADSIDGDTPSSLKSLINQFKTALGDTPFTVEFGNHDSEWRPDFQVPPDRYEQYLCWVEMGALDYDNNFASSDLGGKGTTGCIPILSSDGKGVAYNVVLFDSGSYAIGEKQDGAYAGAYGKPGYEGMPASNYYNAQNEANYLKVVEWFKTMNETLKGYSKNNSYVPSIAFMHIPMREMYNSGILTRVNAGTPGAINFPLTYDVDELAKEISTGYYIANSSNPTVQGVLKEAIACSMTSTYELYKALADKGNVKGVFFGHDHANTIMGKGSIYDAADGRTYELVMGYGSSIDQEYYANVANVGIFTLNETTGEMTRVIDSYENMIKDAYNGVDYITDLGAASSTQTDPEIVTNTLFKDAYQAIDFDCNTGLLSANANKVYLGFKTGSASQAITGIKLYTMAAGAGAPPATLTTTVGGKTVVYTLVSTGPTPSCNLNEGSSGNAVYLYTTKDPAAGAPITSIDIKSVSGTYTPASNETVAGWLNENLSSLSGADMNYGAGATVSNYLVYKTDASSNRVFLYVDDFMSAYESFDADEIAGFDYADSMTATYTSLKNNKSATASQAEIDLFTQTMGGENLSVFKVIITWGSFDYVYYTNPTRVWDSEKSDYVVLSGWASANNDPNAGKITVENRSYASIDISFLYEAKSGYETIEAGFDVETITLDRRNGAKFESVTSTFGITSGDLQTSDTNKVVIGKVSVQITATSLVVADSDTAYMSLVYSSGLDQKDYAYNVINNCAEFLSKYSGSSVDVVKVVDAADIKEIKAENRPHVIIGDVDFPGADTVKRQMLSTYDWVIYAYNGQIFIQAAQEIALYPAMSCFYNILRNLGESGASIELPGNFLMHSQKPGETLSTFAQNAVAGGYHFTDFSFTAFYPAYAVTDELCQELVAAGFKSISIEIGENGQSAQNRAAIQKLAEYGLYVDAVKDWRITYVYSAAYNYSKDEIRNEINTVVNEYSGLPNLLGYFLYDEPHTSKFERMSWMIEAFRELDPTREVFTNLFPSGAGSDQMGVSSFTTYVQNFLSTVKPQYLSYDRYLFYKRFSLTGYYGITEHNANGYFSDLEYIRNQAIENGLDYGKSIQLWSWDSDIAEVEEKQVLWDVNVALAYGYKRLYFFTLYTNDSTNDGKAPSGQRDRMLTISTSIQKKMYPVAEELLGKESTAVFAYGSKVSSQTAYDNRFGSISSSSGARAIIGCFDDGSIYFMNRESIDDRNDTYTFTNSGNIQWFNPTTAQWETPTSTSPIRSNGNGSWTIYLASAEAVLFRIA